VILGRVIVVGVSVRVVMVVVVVMMVMPMIVVVMMGMFVIVMMGMFAIVVVMMVVVVVMVIAVVGLDRAGFLPDGKRPHGHKDEHRDAADQYGKVKSAIEHEFELAALIQQNRDPAEQADHEDREQLLDEIIARRLAVMMVIVRHDFLQGSDQLRLAAHHLGTPVQPFI
jgi:hypothetical protein